jgi:hypothetical protein
MRILKYVILAISFPVALCAECVPAIAVDPTTDEQLCYIRCANPDETSFVIRFLEHGTIGYLYTGDSQVIGSDRSLAMRVGKGESVLVNTYGSDPNRYKFVLAKETADALRRSRTVLFRVVRQSGQGDYLVFVLEGFITARRALAHKCGPMAPKD